MSQNEWNNAWASLQKILILYVPYMIASLIISLCGYLERHWKKEPFSLAKLITGLISDLVYGMTLVLGALWLSGGNHICAMFVLFVGLARGKKWADNMIDKILWQRYGQGAYYGNDPFNPQNDTNNPQGNINNNNDGLDPRE